MGTIRSAVSRYSIVPNIVYVYDFDRRLSVFLEYTFLVCVEEEVRGHSVHDHLFD